MGRWPHDCECESVREVRADEGAVLEDATVESDGSEQCGDADGKNSADAGEDFCSSGGDIVSSCSIDTV